MASNTLHVSVSEWEGSQSVEWWTSVQYCFEFQLLKFELNSNFIYELDL